MHSSSFAQPYWEYEPVPQFGLRIQLEDDGPVGVVAGYKVEKVWASFLKGYDSEKGEVLEDFESHGVVEKTPDGFKPMIPVFTPESFAELEKLITRAIIPLVKELVTASEDKIEKLLLAEMHGVKERIDQFYTFWLCYHLSPIQELYWYGMNVEGLEIPKDYKASAAALYIVR